MDGAAPDGHVQADADSAPEAGLNGHQTGEHSTVKTLSLSVHAELCDQHVDLDNDVQPVCVPTVSQCPPEGHKSGQHPGRLHGRR